MEKPESDSSDSDRDYTSGRERIESSRRKKSEGGRVRRRAERRDDVLEGNSPLARVKTFARRFKLSYL